jgi:hypothetical protein
MHARLRQKPFHSNQYKWWLKIGLAQLNAPPTAALCDDLLRQLYFLKTVAQISYRRGAKYLQEYYLLRNISTFIVFGRYVGV